MYLLHWWFMYYIQWKINSSPKLNFYFSLWNMKAHENGGSMQFTCFVELALSLSISYCFSPALGKFKKFETGPNLLYLTAWPWRLGQRAFAHCSRSPGTGRSRVIFGRAGGRRVSGQICTGTIAKHVAGGSTQCRREKSKLEEETKVL